MKTEERMESEEEPKEDLPKKVSAKANASKKDGKKSSVKKESTSETSNGKEVATKSLKTEERTESEEEEEPKEDLPKKASSKSTNKDVKKSLVKKVSSETSPKNETTNKSTASPKAVHSFFISKKAANSDDGGAQYDPAKSKYHPVDDAFWAAGESVPYLALTKTFAQIEEMSGRLRMIEVLANFFRSVIALSPQDLVACVYLCQNQLAPAYVGLELGLAEMSLMKIIGQTTGRSLAQIRADTKNTGDLGLVAEQSKSNQRMMIVPAALQVRGVFGKLQEIAKMTGTAVRFANCVYISEFNAIKSDIVYGEKRG